MLRALRSARRRFRARFARDVRYDLVEQLVEALCVRETAQIEDTLDGLAADELYAEIVGSEYFADLFDSQCVGCGSHGTWSIRSSLCPGCLGSADAADAPALRFTSPAPYREAPIECPICSGRISLVCESREVPVGSRMVRFDDTFGRCTSCGETFYTPAQARRSFRLAGLHAEVAGVAT